MNRIIISISIVVFAIFNMCSVSEEHDEIPLSEVTIAGQTAPSPGITIIKGSLAIRTHDVVVRHIRVRPGDAGEPKKSGWEIDGIYTSGKDAYNIEIDHCCIDHGNKPTWIP